jgi:type I restriction enzyme, S subunit
VSWTQKPLAQVAELCLGKMLDEKKNRGAPMAYLANINVRWGEFDFANLREMRFEPNEFERYGLKYGDIVMCEGGEPGRCAIWKDEVPGMMIQKALHRIRPHEELDYRFLFYSFLLKGRNNGFSGLFTGSTIKHLPGQNLAKVEVSYPSRVEQERIADILSTYDDLIENNRRRIALLEQSARLLYREWFVYLRFPGHEHVKVVDGVPEGWGKKQISEVCASIDYGFTASSTSECIGPKFLRITDIVPDVIDWSSVPYCEIEDEKLEKFRLAKGDIVVARTGATVGYAKILYGSQPAAVFASYLVRFKPESEALASILGVYMESQEYKEFIRSRIGGAAQPNANAKVLASAQLLIPPPEILDEFHDIVSYQFEQREKLQALSEKLREVRDLLLPRLMNGEIPV